MARTNETPDQKRARTAKARATFQSRFSSPEERSEYYRQIVLKRHANRANGSGGRRDRSTAPEQLELPGLPDEVAS